MGANRELLERSIDAENRGDFQALALLWAEDAVRMDPMQTLRGRDAIIDFHRRTRESMPDVFATVDHAVEEGDCVAWEAVATATNTGPLHLPAGRTLPPTGRRTEQRIAGFARIRDGQCVFLRIYFDQLEALRQLGFMPAPALAIGGVGGVLGGVWATRVSPHLRDWRSRVGR
jgi:steroid delta-isomerase-like uncharacterized protein